MQVLNIRLGVYVAIGCLALVGCGPSGRAEVSGHVTLAGQPLPDGMVTFRPTAETSGPEFSGTIAGGEYKVAKPSLPGTYAVEVRAWKKTGRIVKSPFGIDTDEIVSAVPQRYWGPQTELRAQLQPGPNTVHFDLQP